MTKKQARKVVRHDRHLVRECRAGIVAFLRNLEVQELRHASECAASLADMLGVAAKQAGRFDYCDLEARLLDVTMALGEARGHGNAAADIAEGADEATVT